MFLRTTRRKNADGSFVSYYQLAENHWNSDKRRPEVRIVHNFGRADALDPETLRRLARSISRVADGGLDLEVGRSGSPDEIEIEWSRPIGGVHLARALWEELGIGATLREHPAAARRAAPHETALFAMVANRLLEPASKLACHEHWLADGVYLPEADSLTLEQLYRAMDFLMENVEEIERAVFFRTADLFNADVDLIFWDTTTVWFETDEEDAEEADRKPGRPGAVRRRGHSKEGRDNDPQVVVGLAVTRDGLPVRSWVFPGNTMDATTVATVREGLRQWNLNRVILVGDAGMDSDENRKVLSRGLGRYILAVPSGRLKEVQEEVLTRPGRYSKVSDRLEVKEVVVGDGERRRRYVVCRNLAEAERQKAHREEILEELRIELGILGRGRKDHPKRACDLLASGRYGRYLSTGAKGEPVLDLEKVKKAERMDGRWVLLTNDDSLTPEDVGSGYKAMMIIEGCFRRMKTSGLRIRPVYHWTPGRITAHVKLCVLALLLERAAEIRSGESWRNIRRAVEQIRAVRYRSGSKTIVQTTPGSPEADRILVSLSISRPKKILAISPTEPTPLQT